jgi:glutathione synthase
MDPIKKLNYETDSTISLIKNGLKIGIDVWITEPKELTLFNGRIFFNAKQIIGQDLKIKKSKEVLLENFDFFFIRQDPPFDMNYITNCYLLEIHKESRKNPYFVNDPTGIKNFTEKIFPMYFKELMPRTMVTSSRKSFDGMLNRYGKLVLKSLYNKGGEGVHKISKDDKNAHKLFQETVVKYKTPIVVQQFLSKVSKGDKRVIIIDGTPIGVVNRIPKPGEFKANLHLGAKAERTTLTKKEKQICSKLRPILKKNNLFFVGIDLINEKLTEINVTSPTGITQIDQLYQTNLSNLIWKKLLIKT